MQNDFSNLGLLLKQLTIALIENTSIDQHSLRNFSQKLLRYFA